ncbi:MAG: hypothetical protein JWP19_1643 [Rhodoglobus sp.]|jgi:hypothetical protein|nr:hypothetical protein [Rhodoglobus sp.]
MGFMDMFRPVNDPIAGGVPGTAQVVSASTYSGTGTYQKCAMHLVINAPGITPTAVEFNGIVHNAQWPVVGSTLPVSVDPANPAKFAILWAQVPSAHEAARPAAEGIAAALRGDPDALAGLVGGGLLGGGNVQVIGDPTHITPEAREKLKAFGIDIDSLVAGAAQSGGTSPFTFAPPAAAAGDSVSQLERLAALKDKGVLTEAEFAKEKKKILG